MPADILAKTGIDKSITIARFKTGNSKSSTPMPNPGLTTSERQLADIVDIGSAAKERAEKTRKLDGYLRLFQSVMKFINGTSNSRVSVQPLEIEYVKLENPYL